MARAPHRLFGVLDGAQACSAAQWAELAKGEIGRAHEEGRLPILVGGTGLYIRTLLDGIAPVPEIDPAIRAEVRAMTVAQAHLALTREDPESAARLAPADSARTARALEVVRSTGRSILWWRSQKSGGIGNEISLAPLVLLPPRDWLFTRCEARFEGMLKEGAVEEVRSLVARNLSRDLPVMRAIGVREIARWLAGELDHDSMVALVCTATRQYAKRQYTWFSRQPLPAWPRWSEPVNNNTEEIVEILFQ